MKDEETGRDDGNTDDEAGKFLFAPIGKGADFLGRSVRGSFQSLRRHFERPRNAHGEDKTESEQDNESLHHPAGRFERRQQNRSGLNQKPRDYRIRDRNFVNVAPLQLRK